MGPWIELAVVMLAVYGGVSLWRDVSGFLAQRRHMKELRRDGRANHPSTRKDQR